MSASKENNMKKLLPILSIALFVAAIAIVFVSMAKKDTPITIVKGNTAFKPLPIKIGKTNDTQCAMIIKSMRNTAEVISPDGKTWFFDDPGCMILWLKERSWADKAVLWVHTLDTKQWIDARKAWYGVSDHTEMHYGFGAREKKCNECIGFDEMRMRMLRGENLTDPKIRKKLLGV
jgi:nitrous oxide reductase accessory protein NosL